MRSSEGRRPGRGFTSQREHFCRLIAISGYTSSDAYEEAYNVKPETLRKTVTEAASRLRAIPEVRERIEALQERLLTKELKEGRLTLEAHLQELGGLQVLAVELGQLGPAITAAHYRGKASGLYIEKTQSATSSLEELVAGTASDRGEEYDSGRPVKASARSVRRKRS